MSTLAPVTPTGSINGINSTFVVVTTSTTMEVYKNGQLQMDGGADYTLSTATTTGTATTTLTFQPASIPQTGDALVAWVFNQ